MDSELRNALEKPYYESAMASASWPNNPGPHALNSLSRLCPVQMTFHSLLTLSLLRPQLASHSVRYREVYRYSPSGRRRQGESMAYLIRRHIDVYSLGNEILYSITGEVSGIG